jgi:hypothetical protein
MTLGSRRPLALRPGDSVVAPAAAVTEDDGHAVTARPGSTPATPDR